ncbi:MAG: alpha/beta hydrolase [Myxococcales bacterium]|nr:alpha/beta hydrolase [Myxococcales bacterium]
MTDVLLVPGLYNSGPEHWQSYWERTRGDCTRIVQRDWETPRREDWMATLDAAIVASARTAPVLVGHSLGCATIAHWARSATARPSRRIRGALLVAPSDVDAPSYPTGTTGFVPMPLERLPFPAIVVASSDDEYVSVARAAEFAHAWGARLIEIGTYGHINSSSGLGAWMEGQRLLDELLGG